jgi:hypothetical protein
MHNASPETPVVIAGVGALGSLFVRAAAYDQRLRIVGAVDNDPAKAGRSLSEVAGESGAPDVVVSASLSEALATATTRPSVFVHMTESRPDRIRPLLLEALGAGLNVLSAAESMFFPQLRYPEFASALNAEAQQVGVTVTGTGINPGFTFDQLVLDAAAATAGVTGLSLDRVVVVADTGPGDVEHVGFGLPEAEFRKRIAEGTIEGHMGLPESFAQLAARLGLPIDRITESWEPVTSDQVVPSAIGDIPPGRVIGIVQGASAFQGEVEVMTARLAMYYRDGIEPSHDRIELRGLHDITMSMTPAAISILGAAIILANTTSLLPSAPAGLVSVLDLPTRAARTADTYAYEADASRPGLVAIRRSATGRTGSTITG